jgi:hypothetical protein
LYFLHGIVRLLQQAVQTGDGLMPVERWNPPARKLALNGVQVWVFTTFGNTVTNHPPAVLLANDMSFDRIRIQR